MNWNSSHLSDQSDRVKIVFSSCDKLIKKTLGRRQRLSLFLLYSRLNDRVKVLKLTHVPVRCRRPIEREEKRAQHASFALIDSIEGDDLIQVELSWQERDDCLSLIIALVVDRWSERREKERERNLSSGR